MPDASFLERDVIFRESFLASEVDPQLISSEILPDKMKKTNYLRTIVSMKLKAVLGLFFKKS